MDSAVAHECTLTERVSKRYIYFPVGGCASDGGRRARAKNKARLGNSREFKKHGKSTFQRQRSRVLHGGRLDHASSLCKRPSRRKGAWRTRVRVFLRNGFLESCMYNETINHTRGLERSIIRWQVR